MKFLIALAKVGIIIMQLKAYFPSLKMVRNPALFVPLVKSST
jgi:hypothetical protein